VVQLCSLQTFGSVIHNPTSRSQHKPWNNPDACYGLTQRLCFPVRLSEKLEDDWLIKKKERSGAASSSYDGPNVWSVDRHTSKGCDASSAHREYDPCHVYLRNLTIRRVYKVVRNRSLTSCRVRIKTGLRAHRYIGKVNLQELPKPFMGFWGYTFLQKKELVHSAKSQAMN
jgi:hypothetical protein